MQRHWIPAFAGMTSMRNVEYQIRMQMRIVGWRLMTLAAAAAARDRALGPMACAGAAYFARIAIAGRPPSASLRLASASSDAVV
jgi:hypothetical protein